MIVRSNRGTLSVRSNRGTLSVRSNRGTLNVRSNRITLSVQIDISRAQERLVKKTITNMIIYPIMAHFV